MVVDVGIVESVQEDIAGIEVGEVWFEYAIFKQQLTAQARLGCCSRALAGVIGLHRALGDDGICVLRYGVRHQELQLAGFVTAAGEPRAIVPFDIDLRGHPDVR